ncbi:MAG: hypothetical protein JXR63_11705 [Spirochaetales bacterium]|nr:hypothetical protein [Spirochaetales bacterium]
MSVQTLCLRRINRIKTVHGSLAIERNTLSIEQITAILEGKHILAPPGEIILTAIFEAILNLSDNTPEVAPSVTPEVKRLLEALTGTMSRTELMIKLDLKDEKNFRTNYIQKALKENLIERTIPEKPNSRLQKYRLTRTGISYLKLLQKEEK